MTHVYVSFSLYTSFAYSIFKKLGVQFSIFLSTLYCNNILFCLKIFNFLVIILFIILVFFIFVVLILLFNLNFMIMSNFLCFSPSELDVLKRSIELLLSKRRWELTSNCPMRLKQFYFRDAVELTELLLKFDDYAYKL